MQEAFARLADDDPMEVLIEMVPNNGWTQVEEWTRNKVEGRLKLNTVCESGTQAQARDYGLHVHLTIFDGPNGAQGLGRVFFKTKPECRLNAQQLVESLQRGHGAALFSEKADATTTEGTI